MLKPLKKIIVYISLQRKHCVKNRKKLSVLILAFSLRLRYSRDPKKKKKASSNYT